MADLVYNQTRFEEQIRRLDQNIRELESELESFNQNYEVVKKNWMGSEFEKAEPKLLEIKKTLETALNDSKTQRNYLDKKNQDFASQLSGF